MAATSASVRLLTARKRQARSRQRSCKEPRDERERMEAVASSREEERTRGTRIAAGTASPGLTPTRTQARRNGSAWILARVVKGTCRRLGTSTSASCAAGWRFGSVQARGMSAIVDHTSTSIDPGRTIGRISLSNRSCPYQTSGLDRTAPVGRSGEPGEPRPIPAAGHNRSHNLGERGVPPHLLGGVKPAQRLPRYSFRLEGVLSPRGGFETVAVAPASLGQKRTIPYDKRSNDAISSEAETRQHSLRWMECSRDRASYEAHEVSKLRGNPSPGPPRPSPRVQVQASIVLRFVLE